MLLKLLESTFLVFMLLQETRDISRMNELNVLQKNYLKRSFGKWLANQNNLDSREIKDLIWVRAHVDGRS